MKNWRAVATDYYVERLTNELIFEKYSLIRKRANITQERIYEHLPSYEFTDVDCERCGGILSSTFVGKNASLSQKKFKELIAGTNQLKKIEHSEIPSSNRLKDNSGRGALLVEDSYRVSYPICKQCGHTLKALCNCNGCIKQKEGNAQKASIHVYESYNKQEKINLESLQCLDLMILIDCFSESESLLQSRFRQNEIQNNLSVDQHLSFFLLGATTLEKDSVIDSIIMETVNSYRVDIKLLRFTLISHDSIQRVLLKLKALTKTCLLDEIKQSSVIELWHQFALREAQDVLMHYCKVHEIAYRPGDKTNQAIRRSLSKFGLAQTARYIYNSVWYSRKQANESGYNNYRAFNQIYGNLNFWIDDPRARTYTAYPFVRKDGVLNESQEVAIFNRSFLEPHGVDYFIDPISTERFNDI